MKIINGTYKADDGLDYYNIALNLKTGEYIMIKNASCSAVAYDMANEYFQVSNNLYLESGIKIFFQGNHSELYLDMIPKKYHKFFKE